MASKGGFWAKHKTTGKRYAVNADGKVLGGHDVALSDLQGVQKGSAEQATTSLVGGGKMTKSEFRKRTETLVSALGVSAERSRVSESIYIEGVLRVSLHPLPPSYSLPEAGEVVVGEYDSWTVAAGAIVSKLSRAGVSVNERAAKRYTQRSEKARAQIRSAADRRVAQVVAIEAARDVARATEGTYQNYMQQAKREAEERGLFGKARKRFLSKRSSKWRG